MFLMISEGFMSLLGYDKMVDWEFFFDYWFIYL